MGRQINFFMMPEDVAELDKKVKESGLVIVTELMPTADIQILDSLSNKPRERKYLMLLSDISNISAEYLPTKKSYWINSFRTPIIEIDNSFFDLEKNILHEGRVYFEKHILGVDNKSQSVSAELLQKADDLFKWLRKKIVSKKVNNSYVSVNAMNQAITFDTELRTGSNTSINQYIKNQVVYAEKRT